MPRVKRGVTARARHKKIIGMAKGHKGQRHRVFRRANESVLHSLDYAYGHRRERKGDFRKLWIARINAAARLNGTTYSRLINAPTSMVGHDDLYCYRSIQEGLAAGASDWISLHRNYSAAEAAGFAGTYGATSEIPMRGQYHAWAEFMTLGMKEGSA